MRTFIAVSRYEVLARQPDLGQLKEQVCVGGFALMLATNLCANAGLWRGCALGLAQASGLQFMVAYLRHQVIGPVRLEMPTFPAGTGGYVFKSGSSLGPKSSLLICTYVNCGRQIGLSSECHVASVLTSLK